MESCESNRSERVSCTQIGTEVSGRLNSSPRFLGRLSPKRECQIFARREAIPDSWSSCCTRMTGPGVITGYWPKNWEPVAIESARSKSSHVLYDPGGATKKATAPSGSHSFIVQVAEKSA